MPQSDGHVMAKSYKSKTKLNVGNVDLYIRRKLAKIESAIDTDEFPDH